MHNLAQGVEAPQFARVPRRVARAAAEAAAELEAREGRPLRAGDLLREAMAEGLPAVLARRGLSVPPLPVEGSQVGRRPLPLPEAVRAALIEARHLLAAGRAQRAVCAELNRRGLLNTWTGTARPWAVDALRRALRREGLAE